MFNEVRPDDKDLVDAAAKKMLAARGSLEAARKALKAAEIAEAQALRASLRAASSIGEADGTLMSKRRRLTDASAHTRFCREDVGRLEVEERTATAAHAATAGAAHAPLYAAGVKGRIAAAAKADRARALLAAAEEDFRKATAKIDRAHARHCAHPDGIDDAMLVGPVRTEADERALWQGAMR